MSAVVDIDGRTLSLHDLQRVAEDPSVEIRLASTARGAIEASRAVVERQVSSGRTVYGVNTGFGRLAEVYIPEADTVALQHNLVRSHASGVGEPLSVPAVRALMLLRANALARGVSGCRVVLVEALLDLLNHGVHPVVPSFGSVGASGDLAPLAHVALTLLGEGEAHFEGRRVAVADAMERTGLSPLTLRAKEGLALINGTQATTALGSLALLAFERAIDAAEVIAAMSLDALLGSPEAFRAEIQEARPHAGQARSAEHMRTLLEGSEIRESHREGDTRVQDAYALRCIPQVHGAARHAAAYARGILEVEANSATDNPLVFAEHDVIVSGGNFHAQIVAQALDLLAIAIADLAAISERRTERLLNPDLSMGLPAFLARNPGLESGFMIAQVTAVDLLAELRILAGPASIDSVPTSASQEDHVSMGFTSARKLARAVEGLDYILGIELMCAAEGLEYRRPLRSAEAVERAHALLRAQVPRLDGDRALGGDLEEAAELVRSGTLSTTDHGVRR